MKELILKDKTISPKIGDSLYIVDNNNQTRFNRNVTATIIKISRKYLTLSNGQQISFEGKVNSPYSLNYTLYSSYEAFFFRYCHEQRIKYLTKYFTNPNVGSLYDYSKRDLINQMFKIANPTGEY